MKAEPFLALFAEALVLDETSTSATNTFTEQREDPDRDYGGLSLGTKTFTRAREEDDTDISALSGFWDIDVL